MSTVVPLLVERRDWIPIPNAASRASLQSPIQSQELEAGREDSKFLLSGQSQAPHKIQILL